MSTESKPANMLFRRTSPPRGRGISENHGNTRLLLSAYFASFQFWPTPISTRKGTLSG